MRELEPQSKVEELAKQKQEYKFLGRVRIRRGHKLFRFDTKTKILEEVIPQEKAILKGGKVIKTKKVEYQENSIYITSLNLKNAKKKLLKSLQKISKK